MNDTMLENGMVLPERHERERQGYSHEQDERFDDFGGNGNEYICISCRETFYEADGCPATYESPAESWCPYCGSEEVYCDITVCDYCDSAKADPEMSDIPRMCWGCYEEAIKKLRDYVEAQDDNAVMDVFCNLTN